MRCIYVLSCLLLVAGQALSAATGKAELKTVHLKTKSNGQLRSGSFDPRIMNGTLAVTGQFPYQAAVVAVVNNTQAGFCGGSLISPNVVLTAAHCLMLTEEFDIVLGTLQALNASDTNRVVMRTSNKILHPNFDFDFGLNNDIGLVILPQSVTLNSNIQPVKLPRRRDDSESFVRRNGIASGWGIIGDVGGFINEDLLWAEVGIIDSAQCEVTYGTAYIPPTKMCISTNNGTNGPCNGDSGGPLVLNNSAGEQIIAGLVSFGANAGCESGYPEVFTRISSFIDWIAANGGPAVRP